MVFEDFTTFTKVDPGGYFTVEDHRITATDMLRSVESYVKKDYGVNHFGDFEHLQLGTLTVTEDDSFLVLWILASNSATNVFADCIVTNEAIAIWFQRAVDAVSFRMQEFLNDDIDVYAGLEPPLTFYITTKRAGTAGTVKIYSDAARSNLLDTLAIDAPSTKYQYLIAMASRKSGTTEKVTGTSENLDLQEPAVEVEGMIFKRPGVRVASMSGM